jgi:hypothetical protein
MRPANGTRRPIRLTRRGENVLAVLWTVTILIGSAVLLIATLALAGAIEGGF